MNRRTYGTALAVAALALLLAPTVGCLPKTKGTPAMLSETAILDTCRALEDEYQCRLAMAFEDVRTGRRIEYRPDEVFHAASLMKVPVMIEVFRRVEAGEFALDDEIPVKNQFPSIASGDPFVCDGRAEMQALIGQTAPIRLVTELMIVVSDNLATNLLIERVGAKHVMATIEALGVRHTQVLRGVMDMDAYNRGMNNTTTARDMTVLMAAIARGKAVGPEADREMREILLRQRFRQGIPAGVPERAQVACKGGSITAHRHDSGLVTLENGRGFALSVLIDGLADGERGDGAIARITREIFTAWENAGPN